MRGMARPRKCNYWDEMGVRCGRPSSEHGYVLSGPDDGDLIEHPFIQGGPREWAEEVSRRWRWARQLPPGALEAIDRAEGRVAAARTEGASS